MRKSNLLIIVSLFISLILSGFQCSSTELTSARLYIQQKNYEKAIDALIKDVQFDTFGRKILHVDFVRIALTEKVTTHVPVVLYGTSQGVKEGGILDHALKEVEIECLPTEIPKNIRINISELAIGKTVHISDLELPANAKVLGNPDAIVVSVHFATEEKYMKQFDYPEYEQHKKEHDSFLEEVINFKNCFVLEKVS